MLAALLFGAASQAADMALAPSPALACLTLPAEVPGRPEYPAEALERKQGGEVRVQLVFRYPDQQPTVKILHSSTIDQLDDVVEKHVRQYRVPCVKPGDGPVTLLQEYVFDPDGSSRVMASTPRDDADIARAAQMECVRHVDADSKPMYPKDSVRNDEEGTLLAKMHFTAPDKPPALAWVAASPYKRLSRSVEQFAQGLTLPCLRDGPVDIIMAFRFFMGVAPPVFKDTSLATLVGASKDLAKPVFFDLNGMACPFDVRLSYHRPFANNTVQQLDTLNPARHPLLDWLAGLTLNVKEADQVRLYGNTMIVRIPCGKIDL